MIAATGIRCDASGDLSGTQPSYLDALTERNRIALQRTFLSSMDAAQEVERRQMSPDPCVNSH